MFKPDEAACLFAERFNIIGWIYEQEPIMFNRLASKLAALLTWGAFHLTSATLACIISSSL